MRVTDLLLSIIEEKGNSMIFFLYVRPKFSVFKKNV